MWETLAVALSVVTSLIGLGWALDSNLSDRWKRRTDVWTRRQLHRLRRGQFGGQRFFDRIFGPKIISWRAFAVTAMISSSSWIFFFFIAYITSDQLIRDQINPIQGKISQFEILLITVYVVAIIFSDFLSYAQTRIFVSALDSIRNIPVGLILYCADAILSIGIFLFGYAFARSIVTIAAASAFYAAPFDRVSALSPEVVISSYKALGLPKVDHRIDRLEKALEAYELTPTRHSVNELEGSLVDIEYAGTGSYVRDKRLVRISCLEDLSFESEPKTHIYEIFDDSVRMANEIVGIPGFRLTNGGAISFYKAPRGPSEAKPCQFHVAEIHAKVEPRQLLRQLSLIDYFLGSLTSTLQDLQFDVATKLSVFPADEPGMNAPTILNIALLSHNSNVLGIGQKKSTLGSNLFTHTIHIGNIRVPLGPVAASSIVSNIMFAIYLAAIVSAYWSSRIFAIAYIKGLSRPSRVYFRLSIGVVSLILAAWISFLIANALAGSVLTLIVSHPIVG